MQGWSNPQLTVERAILNGFREMLRLDDLLLRKVSDGAGDFDDLVVGAGGEVEIVQGRFQERGRSRRQRAGGVQINAIQQRSREFGTMISWELRDAKRKRITIELTRKM